MYLLNEFFRIFIGISLTSLKYRSGKEQTVHGPFTIVPSVKNDYHNHIKFKAIFFIKLYSCNDSRNITKYFHILCL